jgi:hypothetical protein
MITSLLLSYEQAYRNNFDYNKLTPDQMAKKSKDNGCVAFTTVVIRGIIRLGLHTANCIEHMIIILQIILLLCEQKEIIEKPDLIPLFTMITDCLTGVVSSGDKATKVFEVLSICSIIKILDMISFTKGKDPLLDNVITNKPFLAKVCLMRKFKPHVKLYTEMLISKLGQYSSYYKPLVAEIKDKVSFDVIMKDGRCEAK